jgi:membrane protein DedA with SNARE-associated domain
VATLIAWLEHIGAAAVFVLVLVEQGGLPRPAYPLLILAGVWSARGGAPIAWITRLMIMGFHPVRTLVGGIHAWQDAGLAVERS